MLPAYSTPSTPTQNSVHASKKLTLQERLHQAEHDVHNAQNENDSQRAWKRAERLRQRDLGAGGKIIFQDASEQAQSGSIERAEHHLSAALTLQPNSALLRRQRAAIRILGNDPTGAVQDLGISLNIDPRDPTTWLLLAETQERLHHNGLALHAFEEAVSCAPYLPNKEKLFTHYTELAHGHED